MREVYQIIVHDEPTPLSRPRFVRTPKGGRAFTPTKDHEAQRRIRESWVFAHPDIFFPATVALELTVVVKVTPPKTLSLKARKAGVRPVKRPDLDNYVKQVMDALLGYAYQDDSQVVEFGPRTGKYYAIQRETGILERPRWIISLKQVSE